MRFLILVLKKEKDQKFQIKSDNSKPQETLSSKVEKINSSVPGKVFKVFFKEGDMIKKDDVIIILEAMKMEIEVKSPKNGVISSMNVSVGDNVDNNDTIIYYVRKKAYECFKVNFFYFS